MGLLSSDDDASGVETTFGLITTDGQRVFGIVNDPDVDGLEAGSDEIDLIVR